VTPTPSGDGDTNTDGNSRPAFSLDQQSLHVDQSEGRVIAESGCQTRDIQREGILVRFSTDFIIAFVAFASLLGVLLLLLGLILSVCAGATNKSAKEAWRP
jgi:hypothetical protein